MRYLRALLPLTLLPLSSPAALVWTGGGDSISLYQEANWQEDDGSALEANEINPNVLVTADTGGQIIISTGTGTPSNFGGNFVIGTNTIEISGGKTLASGSAGVSASASTAGLVDSGNVRLQFSLNLAWTLDNTASLRFNGDGNPLNGSTVNVLDTGSVLSFDDEEYAGAGNFQDSHQSKVTFQGNALVFGADPFAAEPGDNAIATAVNPDGDGIPGVQINFIPEPSAAILAAFAGLLALRRRR